MTINKESKRILLAALETEALRVKRAINASNNQAIKEILNIELQSIKELFGYLQNEVVK